jgi:hypothetical protein
MAEPRYAIFNTQNNKLLWEDQNYQDCARMFFRFEDAFIALKRDETYLIMVDRKINPNRAVSVVYNGD